MTRKQRRMTIIGGSLAVLALAAALVLNALRDSIVFFSTPTMVAFGRRSAVSARSTSSACAAMPKSASKGRSDSP